MFQLHIHFMSLLFCSALLALPPLGVFHRPVCHPFTVHTGPCFPFPGSAKCSNRRLSCIRKLICVLVISRPLHVLILWFEDYFMQIYAFTTAKSTRNHNKNFHHLLTYDRWSIASAVDQPDKYKFNLRYSQIHLMI